MHARGRRTRAALCVTALGSVYALLVRPRLVRWGASDDELDAPFPGVEVDNFGHPSADRVHPEWQEIHVGDRFTGKPDGSESWQVAVLEPERFLGLRMSLDLRGRPFDPAGGRPRRYTDSTWGFLLTQWPGGRTRLVVSGYWAMQPRWLQHVVGVAVVEPAHWVMQTRQFANLRRRAEREETAFRPDLVGVSAPGHLRPGARHA